MQFVYTDDTQVRHPSSYYMKYGVGENVLSCVQCYLCNKVTKINVTQSNDDEPQCIGTLLILIALTLKVVSQQMSVCINKKKYSSRKKCLAHVTKYFAFRMQDNL